MNIAYLCSDFGIPIHGNKGASIHVRELSQALTGLGHRVEIIAPRIGGDAPDDFGVAVHELGLGPHDKHLFGLLRDDPAGGEPAAKEIRSMLYATGLRHTAMPVLRELRPAAIYERYALLGTAGSALAHELGVPHILEVNAPLSEEQAIHRGSVFAQTARAIEQTVLSSATHVIAVSEPLKRWMAGIGVAPERVTVASNGVAAERFARGATGAAEVRRRYGLTGQPVIGFVGTLKGWHGTAQLIRAMATIAGQREGTDLPHLLIVGDGPERPALESLAREEGIAHLTIFTGTVDHGEMPAHIAAMDIATAPYDERPDHYFSPLKLFEYMASGRAIVAADIGQIGSCIRDGQTGLLYRPGDITSLAERLAYLLDDPASAQALGHAAQRVARERHGWSANARTVIDLIETAVQQRTGHRSDLAATKGLR
jgi:glycosyltransferase involved in cell wall biosynthesis